MKATRCGIATEDERPRTGRPQGHEEIDLPSFIGDLLDVVGVVGRHARQCPQVVGSFNEIVDLATLALAEKRIGRAAVMRHRHRLRVLDDALQVPAGVQADELHLGTPLA